MVRVLFIHCAYMVHKWFIDRLQLVHTRNRNGSCIAHKWCVHCSYMVHNLFIIGPLPVPTWFIHGSTMVQAVSISGLCYPHTRKLRPVAPYRLSGPRKRSGRFVIVSRFVACGPPGPSETIKKRSRKRDENDEDGNESETTKSEGRNGVKRNGWKRFGGGTV